MPILWSGSLRPLTAAQLEPIRGVGPGAVVSDSFGPFEILNPKP